MQSFALTFTQLLEGFSSKSVRLPKQVRWQALVVQKQSVKQNLRSWERS